MVMHPSCYTHEACTRGLHPGVVTLFTFVVLHGMMSYGMLSGCCSFPSAVPAPAQG